MDITPIISEEKKRISSYGGGKFTINQDDVYHTSVFVLPNKVVSWDINSINDDAIIESFSKIKEYLEDIDLLLLGGGKSFVPASAEVIKFFKEYNITVEPMDTGAACRTYNVLMPEGRNVAAALVVVD